MLNSHLRNLRAEVFIVLPTASIYPVTFYDWLNAIQINQGDDYIGIYDLFAKNYDFPEFTESEKRQLAIQYCSGAVGIGESSQSSSPLDPTFWSLHPTMERLLMYVQGLSDSDLQGLSSAWLPRWTLALLNKNLCSVSFFYLPTFESPLSPFFLCRWTV